MQPPIANRDHQNPQVYEGETSQSGEHARPCRTMQEYEDPKEFLAPEC